MPNDLVLPDEKDGPAFAALNDRQKQFVLGLLKYGSGKGSRAKIARAAGYEGNDDYVNVQAYRLFHNPLVQRALHEVAAAHLGSFQLMAVDGIASLAESARDEGVKLKALLALADRTGFAAVQQINVTKEDMNVTREQKINEMMSICKRNPKLLDTIPEPTRSYIAAKLEALNALPAPITAEYKEIDPDDALLGVEQ